MPSEANARENAASLSATAYESIFTGIQAGRLKPGALIREAELTLSLGMSRTPLREALQRLQTDGLIVMEAQRGFRIVRLTRLELTELFTAREWAEAAAASLAARFAGEADVACMRQIHSREEKSARDLAAGARYNQQLHATIHDCSRNRYLIAHLRKLTALLALAGDSTRRSAGRTKDALSEHRAIIDAIESHDADLAEQRMREHIRASHRFVLSNYQIDDQMPGG
jgi:DNA-binding GntR family transcriptional regulator